MLEAELAHLRFLRSRCEKGDILTQEDFDFVMRFENDLQSYQNMICGILEHEKKVRENL
ncbi:MAG: hypothetical protein WA144_15385 [Candidatus Methanoperedens sp.]